MSVIKAELHVHTCFSKDSLLSLRQLATVCQKKNVGCVAVTDHNEVEGAFRFREMFPGIKTIIGEEIMTRSGEIIGYFLTKHIKPYMTAEATIEAIKIQCGLTCVPHPFGSHGGGVLDRQVLTKVIDDIDMIECFNGRNMSRRENELAEKFARGYGKIKSVGSDAHTASEVGRCAVMMEDFVDARDFLIKLKKARYIERQLPIIRNYRYSLLGKCKKLASGLVCGRCHLCERREGNEH